MSTIPAVNRAKHLATCTAIGVCMLANKPVLLWGAPGVGKSTVIEDLSEGLGMYVETVLPSIFKASEFNGQATIDDETKQMRLYAPSWLKRVQAKAAEPGVNGTVVFYDELSTAPEEVQAAATRPILTGWVGEDRLPAGTRSIAAANPVDLAAGGYDLTPPLANRFVHLIWNPPADVVRDGFCGAWPAITIPTLDPSKSARAEADRHLRQIGAFLGKNPRFVSDVPEDLDLEHVAFPSPRAWEHLSRMLGVADACGLDEDVHQILAEGTVGRAAGTAYLTYAERLDLPDPEALLADPASWTPPTGRPDIVFAVAAGVVGATTSIPNAERWQACGQVLGAIATSEHADIAVVYGNRWLDARPEHVLPDPAVMGLLSPVLQGLNLVAR